MVKSLGRRRTLLNPQTLDVFPRVLYNSRRRYLAVSVLVLTFGVRFRGSFRGTMQAVRPSLRALHASLLNHLRVPVVAIGGWGNGNVRTMSEEAHAHGTYLDRRDVIDRVLSVVKSSQKVDASKVSETATFKEMGLDSLDEVEVVMALEEEFALEIPDADADKIRSATDAIDYIASHPRAK